MGIFFAQRIDRSFFLPTPPIATKELVPIPTVPKIHAHSSFNGATAEALEIPALTSPPLAQSRPTADSIQALAARDHVRALTLALAESDQPFRDELLQAVLRGWASADANAAADWARSQVYLDSGQALAAVFNGANQHPDDAVRLGRRLSDEDPENAGSYAGYLIYALNRVGKFELAAGVAADGETAFRIDLLTAAYGTWAEHQPKQALLAAAELKDPAMRRAAFEATLSGWAKGNPQELTEVASSLAEGPDRKLALTTALRSWIDQDPAAVAAWANHAKFFPEMEASLEE